MSLFISVNMEAQSAKELLILAGNPDEQKRWVHRLSRKITKMGYVQNVNKDGGGTPG